MGARIHSRRGGTSRGGRSRVVGMVSVAALSLVFQQQTGGNYFSKLAKKIERVKVNLANYWQCLLTATLANDEVVFPPF